MSVIFLWIFLLGKAVFLKREVRIRWVAEVCFCRGCGCWRKGGFVFGYCLCKSIVMLYRHTRYFAGVFLLHWPRFIYTFGMTQTLAAPSWNSLHQAGLFYKKEDVRPAFPPFFGLSEMDRENGFFASSMSFVALDKRTGLGVETECSAGFWARIDFTRGCSDTLPDGLTGGLAGVFRPFGRKCLIGNLTAPPGKKPLIGTAREKMSLAQA